MAARVGAVAEFTVESVDTNELVSCRETALRFDYSDGGRLSLFLRDATSHGTRTRHLRRAQKVIRRHQRVIKHKHTCTHHHRESLIRDTATPPPTCARHPHDASGLIRASLDVVALFVPQEGYHGPSLNLLRGCLLSFRVVHQNCELSRLRYESRGQPVPC